MCCGKDNCCSVDSIVSVDERGQLVLPKDVREKYDIKAGEKLALVSWGKDDSCCIALIKADKMSKMAKDFLGPMADEINK